ncbi:MAG: hypothetical protein QOI21_2983 [Actinomycetota bacterium]|jgi:hypothetical protein|nr:hypothetical protein [Actinomycetota bacterium]
MRTATTSSETTIQRTPEEVFAFVTTPLNWVGTHPVTAEVKGDADSAADIGARWIEVIRAPGETIGQDTHWLATTAAPGHTWVIETDQLAFPGVRCQIVYTFVARDGGTYFRRDMSVLVPDDAEIDPDVVDALLAGVSDSSIHDQYLANVKAKLEMPR